MNFTVFNLATFIGFGVHDHFVRWKVRFTVVVTRSERDLISNYVTARRNNGVLQRAARRTRVTPSTQADTGVTTRRRITALWFVNSAMTNLLRRVAVVLRLFLFVVYEFLSPLQMVRYVILSLIHI